jgi:hypothetical protein
VRRAGRHAATGKTSPRRSAILKVLGIIQANFAIQLGAG